MWQQICSCINSRINSNQRLKHLLSQVILRLFQNLQKSFSTLNTLILLKMFHHLLDNFQRQDPLTAIPSTDRNRIVHASHDCSDIPILHMEVKKKLPSLRIGFHCSLLGLIFEVISLLERTFFKISSNKYVRNTNIISRATDLPFMETFLGARQIIN